MNRFRPIALIAGGLAVGVLASLTIATYSGANDWVATVDGRQINEGDFLDELAELQANPALTELIAGLGQVGAGAVPAQLSAGWLTRLIQQDVIEHLATERDVTPSADDRRQAEAINVQQFQGEESWNMFPAWFRERIIERDALYLAVANDVAGAPTEAELRQAYDATQDQFVQACAAHILVETLEQSQALKSQLDGGADFAELARQNSIDTGSKDQGGELGCAPRNSYVEPFDSTVFTLPLNTVSDPVQTQFGFHLIKVSQRETTPYEQVREQLAQQAQAEAATRFQESLLKAIQDADIKVSPKYCSSFEVSVNGPACVPPELPDPPDGLPVGGEPEPVFPASPLPSGH